MRLIFMKPKLRFRAVGALALGAPSSLYAAYLLVHFPLTTKLSGSRHMATNTMGMFTIAVLTACMTTLVVSQSNTTTSSTYDWDRCVGGPKTGPKQLYERLCAGDMHGECIGAIFRTARSHDLHDCGDECNDAGEKCGGFEYDNYDGEASCVLFTNVTGLKPVTDPSTDMHQCYKKEPPKVPKCKEEVMLGHYKRLCDYTKHGQCQGPDLGTPLKFDSLQACADACTANSACAGFEYDSYDVSTDCYLYSEVRRAEHPDWDDFFHECFKKLPITSTASPTTSVDVSTTVTEATTPVTLPDNLSTGPQPDGASGSVAGVASSAPATKIASILTVIAMTASTFM